MRDAFIAWVMEWYEVNKEEAESICKHDDVTANWYAFQAGVEWSDKQERL